MRAPTPGSDDPKCTLGLIGPQAWGVQWSIEGGPKQLSSVQLVSAAPGKADDPSAMFQGTVMLLSIGVGPLLQGNTYEIDDKTDDTQDQGSGSVQVQDNGDTAVIHATGTTKDGVGDRRDHQLPEREPDVAPARASRRVHQRCTRRTASPARPFSQTVATGHGSASYVWRPDDATNRQLHRWPG